MRVLKMSSLVRESRRSSSRMKVVLSAVEPPTLQFFSSTSAVGPKGPAATAGTMRVPCASLCSPSARRSRCGSLSYGKATTGAAAPAARGCPAASKGHSTESARTNAASSRGVPSGWKSAACTACRVVAASLSSSPRDWSVAKSARSPPTSSSGVPKGSTKGASRSK